MTNVMMWVVNGWIFVGEMAIGDTSDFEEWISRVGRASHWHSSQISSPLTHVRFHLGEFSFETL